MSGRLLASYLVVIAAFAATIGWSLSAQRETARDAALLRDGYTPLLLSIGEALAAQNVLNAQLNHITAARNPVDAREWIETARRVRPLTFATVRGAATKLDLAASPEVARFRAELARDLEAVERFLAADADRFAQLFQALQRGDRAGAERMRDDLLAHETDGARRLRELRERVEREVTRLGEAAARRERRSAGALVGLGAMTLAIGLGMSLYARRVLRPLKRVAERAQAVARGDLTPRPVAPSRDEIGELAVTFEGMVGAIQRANADLVQAERLAAIGKMAAHVTHEIRNPLSSIGLNVELLEEELAAEGRGEALALVNSIKKEVDRLSGIAGEYLSVARRARPRLVRERLEDLVRELHAFVRPELERAGVASRVEVEEELPDVALDEAQMRQALLNLIRNAREAMPAGGDLVVRLSRDPRGGVSLEVDDTGTGIQEEVRESIFDPFFTTKERGTGLGLVVTREIVAAHGGDVVCEPRPAGGTRFRVRLPAPGGGATDGAAPEGDVAGKAAHAGASR